MAKSSGEKVNRKKKSTPTLATDDGIILTPVDGSAVLGDLELKPIEPPPFSRVQRRTKSDLKRAGTTSTPDDTDEPSSGKRKAKAKPLERTSKKGKRSIPKTAQKKIGVENRVRYTPTNVFPNRAICHLIVRYPLTPPGQAWVGTGSFIGPRHVLTAGHVLHKVSEGGWAQTIRVIPGRDDNTWWFNSELLTWPNFKQRSVKGWSEDQDIDFDYGLITLNTGFSVGSFGLLYLSDDHLDNTNAYLIGYPRDLGTGNQQFGVTSGGAITDYDSTLVYYSIDTSGGQSGAGVYRFWNGVRAIFAVHSGEYDSDENCAARITKARHDQIRGWQQQDG